jgi:hypothetical protein
VPGGKAYYWAGGEKIPLEDTAQVAVDVRAAQRAKLWDGELATAATEAGSKVTDDLVLLSAAKLSPKLRDRLEEAGALQPVFRYEDGTLLVVLPEVRVETKDPTTAAALQSVVEDWASDVELEQPRPGRFVLKPASGRGEEALELANHVSEEVNPDAAQARFLRIVPGSKPSPDQRGA